MLRQSVEQNGPRVYAIVAPSISGQFRYAKLGQIVSGIRALGFAGVMEVALGADLVAKEEAAEWAEKKFLTTSCCPAFVEYIKKQFPAMAEHISTNPSPMARIAQLIKEREPEAKVVFIGPCTAKKMEVRREEVRPYVDSAITFEELQALICQPGLGHPRDGGDGTGKRFLLWAYLCAERRRERGGTGGDHRAGHGGVGIPSARL